MELINQKDKRYPEQLLQIKEPPQELYVEGDAKLLKQNSIAIVGSRKSTPYGEKYASIFASQLAKAGITIVSGMAVGIDTVAHSYSMKEIGKTIAVIGSGFEYICLSENYNLYKQIIENGGCVISEYPPEEKENKANYPRRNRIIGGLAMGVLVIEAKYRSGSTITAKHAIQQKKEVFCIPNQLGETNGYSTNLLIKNGANLVMEPEDILEFYPNIEQEKQPETMKIPIEYQEIYQYIGNIPISANELAKLTKKTIAQITEGLCILEIEELIQCMPGNKYIRNIKKGEK